MNQWKRKLTAVGMGALIGLVWGCTIWSRAEEDPAVRKEAGQQEQSDQEQQARILYEAVSQEKLEEYLDEHPEGSCEDERASFRINETLNEAAAHRLLAAMESGYTDGRIPGEGTVEEYLASLPRPSSLPTRRSCCSG